MPTIQNKPLEADTKEISYQNLSLSGGINERLSGRLLADDECTQAINVDISVPGKRRKRLDPVIIASLSTAPAAFQPPSIINGLASMVISGTTYIMAANAGKIFMCHGIPPTGVAYALAGPVINTASYVNFVFANNVQYILDGSGNLFYTDGVTLFPVTVLNANNVSIAPITDYIWYQNRLWFTSGDFLYFTQVNFTPATQPLITDSSINVAVGDGGILRRVLPYRDGQLILFKFGTNGGQGSIHLCDVSSGQPSLFQLNTQPFFDHLNLCSPRCVTRMGFDQNAEVVFATIEGLRTDAFTALDRLVTPSLPFSQNIPNSVASINQAALDSAFTVVWNDELLWAVPVNGVNIPPDFTGQPSPIVTFPTEIFAYTTKIPKENVLNGWTIIQNNPMTCAAVISFNGNGPALFIGTPGGFSTVGAFVQQAFYADAGSTYSETSKRVDHGFPINEKVGAKLTISLADDHNGPITVNALFEDNTLLVVGTFTPQDGLIFPLTFPVTFPINQELTYTFDLHFDGLNGLRKRYKDFRVQILSTSTPSILGWQLDSYIYPTRYQGINDPVNSSTLSLANAINSQPLLATAISEG